MTPVCWFCNHPGVRNLDAKLVEQIDLPKTCEAHLDYQVFYQNKNPFPVAVTPRLVLALAIELEQEKAVRNN